MPGFLGILRLKPIRKQFTVKTKVVIIVNVVHLKKPVSSMKINIFNNSNTNDTTSSLQFRRLKFGKK